MLRLAEMLVSPRLPKYLLCRDLDLAKGIVWGTARLTGDGGASLMWPAPSMKRRGGGVLISTRKHGGFYSARSLGAGESKQPTESALGLGLPMVQLPTALCTAL